MATTEDNVTKIRDLVLADRRLKVREIAETVRISEDRVGHILHDVLGMRKLSADECRACSFHTTSSHFQFKDLIVKLFLMNSGYRDV